MNTTVECLEDSKVKLSVTIPAVEVDARIKETYREIASKNNFPGFRKGRAPRQIIDSTLGREGILAQTTDDIVNEAYPMAIDAEDLRPLGDPTMEQSDIVEEGKDYTFVASVSVTPLLNLVSYEPVEIELVSDKASEAEIEEQVTALRDYYFSFKEVDDRPAEIGDFATVDLKVTFEGKEVPSLTFTERPVELGAKIVPGEIEEQIVGMKLGESKEFDFVAPHDTLASVGGEKDDTAHAEVTLKAVRVKEFDTIDDAWAKEKTGFEDLADLRVHIAESIEGQRKEMLPRLKDQECSYAIAKRLEGEAPKEMIAATQQQLLRDFFNTLQRQGMTYDAYLQSTDLTPVQFQDDIKKQALDMATQSLALDSLFVHREMELTDEDIDKEFEGAGVDDPKALRKEWEEAGRMSTIREAIRRSKASDWLIETAIVTTVDPAEKAKHVADELEAEKAIAEKNATDEAPAVPVAAE